MKDRNAEGYPDPTAARAIKAYKNDTKNCDIEEIVIL